MAWSWQAQRQPRGITHRHSLGERYPQQWHNYWSTHTSNLAEPLTAMSSGTTTTTDAKHLQNTESKFEK
jgi:hypothetical protein